MRLSDLQRALHEQIGELPAKEWAAGPETLPQQLLHQERTSGRADSALAGLMAARLRQVTTTTHRVGLATRWSTARTRPRLRSRAGMVTALAASADGARVVLGGLDDGLWLWTPDAADGELTSLGRVAAPITAVDLSPDGRRAVTSDASGVVTAWEPGVPDGAGQLRLGRHLSAARDVVLLDGGDVVSVGDDGRLLRWPTGAGTFSPVGDLRDGGGECLATLTAPLSAVVALGRHVVVVTNQGRAWRYDLDYPSHAVELTPLPAGDGITALAVAPGRREVVGIDQGNALLAWPLDDPEAGPREVGRHDLRLWSLAVAPDGQNVVAGAVDGQVLAWSLDRVAAPRPLQRHERAVTAVACCVPRTSPDGGTPSPTTVISGGKDGLVLRGRLDDEESPPSDRARIDTWAVAAVDPDTRVITGGRRGVHRWDLTNGDTAPRPVRISGTAVHAVLLLGADGPLVWIAQSKRDLWVQESIVAPGPPRRLTRATAGGYETLAALPDGRRFVAATATGEVEVWDLVSGTAESLGTHGNRPLRVRAVATAPDGRCAATTGHDRQVCLWDLDSRGRTPLGRLDGHGRALAFSPDGERLYAGDSEGGVRCLPLRTNARPWTVGELGQRSVVRSLAPLPRAGAVAATTSEGSVVLWPDAPSDADPKPLTRLVMTGTPLRLLPNTRGLLVTGFDGGLTQLELMTAGNLSACSAAPNRPLAPVPAGVRTGTAKVAVADQWWLNRLPRRPDLATLRGHLIAAGAGTTVMLCSDAPQLARFRARMEELGWTVRTAEADQAARRAELLALVREADGAGHPVVLVSGDSELVASVRRAGLTAEIVSEPEY
ncbi:hypothetical protein [Streptomyces sp. NPDC049970]|uniref:hypothetical protein n=1 Tax=Streptomyces sp. NPDC049970 TaxID=3155033 RepID=UPI003425BAA2